MFFEGFVIVKGRGLFLGSWGVGVFFFVELVVWILLSGYEFMVRDYFGFYVE